MSGSAGDSSGRAHFRMLGVLIAVAAIDMLGFAMIFPVLPYYALALDISPFGIGVIIASFSLTQVMSAPIWGRFSDRYGRRPAILISLGASAVSFLVFGYAASFWVLLLSRVIQGAGGGTTGVLHAYVADTVGPDDRARSLGWLSAATSAGTMIGPVLGSTASGWGRPAPGLIAASFCMANMVFAWFWLREPSGGDAARRTRPRKPVWDTARVVIAHPSRIVSRLVWIYGLGMLAFSAFTAVVILYLEAEFQVEVGAIGYVFFYLSGISVLLRSLLLGPLVARLGETWTLRLGALTLAAGFLSFPLAASLWQFVGLMTLVPIGTALTFPPTTALTSRWSDPAELGTTLGTAQSFAGMSRTVSPLISTTLFQLFSRDAPFLAGALIAGIVILLSLRVSDTASGQTGESAPGSVGESSASTIRAAAAGTRAPSRGP